MGHQVTTSAIHLVHELRDFETIVWTVLRTDRQSAMRPRVLTSSHDPG
jgi:hypothetical protein